jgi:hypothetical protein
MTTRKPRKAKEDPGHAIRATLKDMDFWVLSAYVLTPLLLGTLGGIELIQLCIVIFPLISIVFFIVRRRYLKTLTDEQLRHVVPWSYIYTGRAVSMIILFMTAGSCAMALVNALR